MKDWATATDDFRTYLRFERNMSPLTVKAYTSDVEQFGAFVEPLKPAEVVRKNIEDWLSEIYENRTESSSQARKLSALRSFFKYLQIINDIDASPVEFIDSPKADRRLPDVLSIGEIDALLATIDLSAKQGHRNRAMLETLYSCGLRVSELIEMRLGDLFFDDGIVRVTGKGNKQRLVPVSGEAQRQIELWLGQRRLMKVDSRSADIVFLNLRGRKLSRMTVFNIIKEAAAAAGIAKQISPHTLRHSFATHLLEGGASIRQVQEMLGHESIITTEIYTHLDRTSLRRSLEKHHPLG
jgi:integrase/recombinase XerD